MMLLPIVSLIISFTLLNICKIDIHDNTQNYKDNEIKTHATYHGKKLVADELNLMQEENSPFRYDEKDIGPEGFEVNILFRFGKYYLVSITDFAFASHLEFTAYVLYDLHNKKFTLLYKYYDGPTEEEIYGKPSDEDLNFSIEEEEIDLSKPPGSR